MEDITNEICFLYTDNQVISTKHDNVNLFNLHKPTAHQRKSITIRSETTELSQSGLCSLPIDSI